MDEAETARAEEKLPVRVRLALERARAALQRDEEPNVDDVRVVIRYAGRAEQEQTDG